MTIDPTKLTRRRDPDRADCWHIYCADIHAGTIAKAVGMPNAVNHWNWSAGFYPGSKPGEIKSGSADTFESARAAFEKAWQRFAATRTEADYQARRNQRDWTARKYSVRDQGQPVPAKGRDYLARSTVSAGAPRLARAIGIGPRTALPPKRPAGRAPRLARAIGIGPRTGLPPKRAGSCDTRHGCEECCENDLSHGRTYMR
jgi:hypothetical protein